MDERDPPDPHKGVPADGIAFAKVILGCFIRGRNPLQLVSLKIPNMQPCQCVTSSMTRLVSVGWQKLQEH